MKTRMTLLCLLPLLTFILCREEAGDMHNANPLLPTNESPIDFEIGDSRLYRRTMANIGIEIGSIPDTLTSYSYFEVVKDTVIDSREFFIVEGWDYETGMDSIHIYEKRYAYHISSDTLIEYAFNNFSKGFVSGLLKTGAGGGADLKYNTKAVREYILGKATRRAMYDTTVFFDMVYPIVFPLQIDTPYVYRKANNPDGHLYYRKKYKGQETVEVPAGSILCYVLEWMATEAFQAQGISLIDYVSVEGLIKRSIRVEAEALSDSGSLFTDSIPYHETFELLGYENIDPDTLKPWGMLKDPS